MAVEKASRIPSKSNKLRNVNTVQRESRSIPKKSEIIAFVVNAGMNVTFIFKSRKKVFSSLTEVLLDTYKISKGVTIHVFEVILFKFMKVRYKIPLITI